MDAKNMSKIKEQLGIAALIGVLAAIGGGFVKYGEIITKLERRSRVSRLFCTNCCIRRESNCIRKYG